jgi:hypothetical protein
VNSSRLNCRLICATALTRLRIWQQRPASSSPFSRSMMTRPGRSSRRSRNTARPGNEDDDLLLERDDAEAEGDPEEMEKALFEIRKLVAQVSALSA